MPPERVAIQAAAGRVLAEAVLSGVTLPPADCSAIAAMMKRAVMGVPS